MAQGIVHWASADWALAHFPLPAPKAELLDTAAMVEMLIGHLQLATADDAMPVCQTLHCAHILKTLQGEDGLWPSALNARTGAPCGIHRTRSPVRFFRRLSRLLKSSEFDATFERAGAALVSRRDTWP